MTPPVALCIARAELVSPLAHDLQGTWAALCEGKGGIAPVSRFDVSGLGCTHAACVPELPAGRGGASQLESMLDILTPKLREWPLDEARTMLFTASAKAGVDVLPNCLDAGAAKPELLGRLVPHVLRQGLCRRLGLRELRGENVSAACASGTAAIIRAAQSILAGRCQNALVLAADLVSQFTMSGFCALRAVSASPCRPFDRGRDGLTLGEGACALLLQPCSAVTDRGERPLALLKGWGMASDARHITAPARDGRGLVKAMQQSLCRAGKSHVNAVCAHGTGTVYNDAMEITAFEQVFPSMPPIFSTKGALGHGMAACGAMEAALCAQALADRRLPPTLGCADPEPQLQGLVSDTARAFAGKTMLTCNSGFGGVNAALILEDPEQGEEPWPFS